MRLREIAWLNTVNEVKALKVTAMKRRQRKISETAKLNGRANKYDVMLATTRVVLKYKEELNWVDIKQT